MSHPTDNQAAGPEQFFKDLWLSPIGFSHFGSLIAIAIGAGDAFQFKQFGHEVDLLLIIGGLAAMGVRLANGITGRIGAQGPTGEAGEAGAAGETGTAGRAGATGATGAAGQAGAAGATGAQGPAGTPGAKSL